MRKDAIDFSKLNRVLVVKLRHHGDVLVTSPVFSVLKAHHPHLQIDALIYKETEEMLSLHPSLDRLFTIDRSWKKRGVKYQLAQEWALFQALKDRKYDLLILLTEQWRGLILKHLLKIPFAVVANYRRRQNRFWRSSFTHLYPHTPNRHKVEFHLDALRVLGLHPQAAEKKLSLVVSAEDRRKVDSLLEENGVHGDFILLHPASRWFYKCWEIDKYAALIDNLRSKGYCVVISGAPSPVEYQFISGIKAKARSEVIDVSGKLTLKQLAGLIERATCFVGVDSGPMHIAAAMGTPIVALFGPGNQAVWRPWCDHYEIVSTKPPCQPCSQRGCANSEFSQCVADIEVQDVLAAIERMLRRTASNVVKIEAVNE